MADTKRIRPTDAETSKVFDAPESDAKKPFQIIPVSPSHPNMNSWMLQVKDRKALQDAVNAYFAEENPPENFDTFVHDFYTKRTLDK